MATQPGWATDEPEETLTVSQGWRKAQKRAAGRRRAQKRSSVSRFFLGGKKGFRS